MIPLVQLGKREAMGTTRGLQESSSQDITFPAHFVARLDTLDVITEPRAIFTRFRF